MSGDHNQYQKDKSYLDFECPRCGHCCQAAGEEHMSREAMKQALEALVQLDGIDTETECVTIDVDDVITALRQALGTEQEPVAWRTFDGEGGYDYRSYEMNETYDKEWAERNPNHKGWVEPLYTAPPKREWVGLTDEEIAQGLKESWVTEQAWQSAVWWAEAKLKDKNHG
jgi:hypothetical protein